VCCAVLCSAALVVRRFLQLGQYVANIFAKYGQPGGLVRDGFGQVNSDINLSLL
jgi:hypothetical protein